MAEMLSPGVFITEIDASTIVPTVSNSVCVFGGNFTRGPVDSYLLITSVSELIQYYGYPTNSNYNDWYQCYNFLQYGNKLLISRAANVGGTATAISGCTTLAAASGVNTVTVSTAASLTEGDLIVFGEVVYGETINFYEIVSITDNSITIDRPLDDSLASGTIVNSWIQHMNGVIEAVDINEVTNGIPNDAVTNVYEYVGDLMPINNSSDYDTLETSIPFTNPTGSKIKFIARNPGAWANDIEICIAKPASFEANSTDPANFVPRYAFEGIALDDLFEYAPTGTQIGVVISYAGEIQEIYTVDLDPTAKDYNNKSTYIETVINNNSSYVFAKDNTANTDSVADYTLSYDETNDVYIGKTLSFVYASDSVIQTDDLLNAYDIFSNKEELDIDIVIANELDAGVGAKNLCDTRKDCIGIIGANYGDLVGKKSAAAVSNLIAWRKTGDINYNNMFVVACGNYKYQYDRYNDKYRWINIAGDIAGLRAETSMNRASWWASAGLERGQIKNVTKLAFNPTQGQRDMLYKNGINPIVAFPGQGTVMWGQKTLLDKPSSFDRVNVRGLFNTMERALGKMAKYQIMEFNDTFTRNRIVSMIKPYLSTVQAGRGIQDFLVICDESNNTADVISRNQLIVDIYIKPTYVAEFINLRFTNAGTNSFAEIIGG